MRRLSGMAGCPPPSEGVAGPARRRHHLGRDARGLGGQAGRTRGDERTAILPRSLAQQLVHVLVIGGRIERELRDGGRRAGPSRDMPGMDGRALRASAITPDGRHPGRTAR